MRRAGLIQFARRGVSLVLFTAAAVTLFGDLHWIVPVLLAALALAVYILVPRPTRPDGALGYAAMPAIVMPDVLGFLLGMVFFGLPFLMADDAALQEGIWIIGAVMWGMGGFALAILIIAARYAVSWVLIKPDGLVIANLWAIHDMPFAEIASVRPRERRLPRWVSAALILFGGVRGAGVALLHGNRVAHSIEFLRRDGARLRIGIDAFEDLPAVAAALKDAGVSLKGGLASAAAKGHRKRAR